MAQLKITRIKEWANRRFAYKIFVDGIEQFEIANGQEKMMTVGGRLTLQAKLMWCGSKKIDIETGAKQSQEVRISANKVMNIVLPMIAMIIIATSAAFSFLSENERLKNFMNILLIVMILGILCQVTIWRSRFLDIELTN